MLFDAPTKKNKEITTARCALHATFGLCKHFWSRTIRKQSSICRLLQQNAFSRRIDTPSQEAYVHNMFDPIWTRHICQRAKQPCLGASSKSSRPIYHIHPARKENEMAQQTKD
ncbi:unnamed protein product [Ixodes pacificus]